MSANSFEFTPITSLELYQQQVAQDAKQELVDLTIAIPDVVLDVRYATQRNLLGKPLYQRACAYLRRPVAEALSRVQQVLQKRGLGLCVYDAYRPYSLATRFYEQLRRKGAEEISGWQSFRPNRGCSVDVSLVEYSTGRCVPLPTEYEAATPAAHSRFSNLPAHILLNRCLLMAAMKQQGFVNYPGKWWRFDHKCWSEFDLIDLPFEALER
ncbi:hypothetical protein GCM10027346_10340 [Hymenobacter seoulensis]